MVADVAQALGRLAGGMVDVIDHFVAAGLCEGSEVGQGAKHQGKKCFHGQIITLCWRASVENALFVRPRCQGNVQWVSRRVSSRILVRGVRRRR